MTSNVKKGGSQLSFIHAALLVAAIVVLTVPTSGAVEAENSNQCTGRFNKCELPNVPRRLFKKGENKQGT